MHFASRVDIETQTFVFVLFTNMIMHYKQTVLRIKHLMPIGMLTQITDNCSLRRILYCAWDWIQILLEEITMSWLKIKSWAEWKLKENLYLYAPFKILSHPGKKNMFWTWRSISCIFLLKVDKHLCETAWSHQCVYKKL